MSEGLVRLQVRAVRSGAPRREVLTEWCDSCVVHWSGEIETKLGLLFIEVTLRKCVYCLAVKICKKKRRNKLELVF